MSPHIVTDDTNIFHVQLFDFRERIAQLIVKSMSLRPLTGR